MHKSTVGVMGAYSKATAANDTTPRIQDVHMGPVEGPVGACDGWTARLSDARRTMCTLARST